MVVSIASLASISILPQKNALLAQAAVNLASTIVQSKLNAQHVPQISSLRGKLVDKPATHLHIMIGAQHSVEDATLAPG